MQFFLVLALLGGIACNFHGVLSEQLTGYGSIFSTGEERPGDSIQGIRFFLGGIGLFKAIQIKVNDQWSQRYGTSGGDPQEIPLWEGENIIKITGYRGVCVRGFTAETDYGRVFTIGKAIGQAFSSSPPEEGMGLSGIRGVFGILCIKNMAFDWQYLPEIVTTAEPTTTP
ncbi:prostatic spermine-binding protein-like [Dromiciops gliroides]|uniref:prostatic spermine-binding protein-like n=1 Tax=Dromiciops gliroides TaxID=33562 RepID=UPI001CC6CB1F|nr:prostatic spermine-binding protein-like [Dromiciops gliroides]